MTIKHLLFTIVLGLFFTACGDSSASQENAEEGTTTEETTATEETDTEETAEEDQSKRPSPPMTAEGQIGDAQVTINYSAPSVRNRTVYGDLVPYDQIWRTGANEATTIELSEDLSIEGKALPAGKYAIFTIPAEGSWTVIFNRVTDQWGAYDYDEAQDALRVEVTPSDLEESVEVLQFEVLDDAIALRWADKEVSMAAE